MKITLPIQQTSARNFSSDKLGYWTSLIVKERSQKKIKATREERLPMPPLWGNLKRWGFERRHQCYTHAHTLTRKHNPSWNGWIYYYDDDELRILSYDEYDCKIDIKIVAKNPSFNICDKLDRGIKKDWENPVLAIGFSDGS